MAAPRHLSRTQWAAALVAIGLCWSRAALGNGRYPLANQLVVDPLSPDHLVARTTFGILESHDAGKAWTWICEDALGALAQGEDPAIAVTANGSTVVAFSQGLRISTDGCSWNPAAGIPGGRFAVDVAVNPLRPHEAIVIEVASSDSSYGLHLAKTIDDGRTWTDIGPPLSGFLGTTVEIAPSNPDRVYVSGNIIALQASMIERSDDGGQTFTPFPIGGLAPSVSVYIGAVDPRDPDVVYVRVPPTTDTSGQVLVSRDGGATFSQLWTVAGDVAGFALSPDGATLAIGGPESGLYLGSPSDGGFQAVGTVKPSCLTWTDTRIFACAKEAIDSFSIGVSSDGGAHFTPVLHFPDIAPRDCAPMSSAGSCRAQWSQVATTIGADGGESPRADSGAGPHDGTDPAGSRGCGCKLSGLYRAVRDDGVLGGAVLVALLGASRRYRRMLKDRGNYGAVQR